MKRAVTASAPGKLILCGEHAVVYQRPALVAAVDLRLTAHLNLPAGDEAPSDPGAPIRLSVPVLGLESETTWREVHAYAAASRRRWQDWAEGSHTSGGFGDPFSTVGGEDPDHLLKVALGEAAAALGETAGPSLDVRVDSELPTGCGFGSSAAAALTLVAAYLRLRGVGPEAEGYRGQTVGSRRPWDRLESLALEVERRQHGSPSGVDGATVLHGGFVWAERDGDGKLAFQTFAARSPLLTGGADPKDPVPGESAFRAPAPDSTASIAGSPTSSLAIYDSGRPAEGTGAVVAEVRRRWRAEPARYEALWDEMESATRAFRGLLLDGSGADSDLPVDLIRRCQRVLEEIGVVPEPVRELVAQVEAAGGAAKISGAGSLNGPGAGILIACHPHPAALDSLPALSGLRRFPVRLGGPGLQVDGAPSAQEIA